MVVKEIWESRRRKKNCRWICHLTQHSSHLVISQDKVFSTVGFVLYPHVGFLIFSFFFFFLTYHCIFNMSLTILAKDTSYFCGCDFSLLPSSSPKSSPILLVAVQAYLIFWQRKSCSLAGLWCSREILEHGYELGESLDPLGNHLHPYGVVTMGTGEAGLLESNSRPPQTGIHGWRQELEAPPGGGESQGSESDLFQVL